MKNSCILVIFLIAAFLLCNAGSAFSQAKKPSPAPTETMAPVVKLTPPAAATPAAQARMKTIFDFEKELGLSADQTKKLKDQVNSFNKEIASNNDKLKAANKELGDLINANAALDKIKEKLQQIGAIELDIRLANVKTSKVVNETLTKDQLAKWREIQKRERQVK
ncbi:MAG: hypothetical protein RDV48_23705 [Candidatus Eremiobacteraeota bacterium]|nr:hypothetical protein [Candidatus Eremiobacteraeota bacterium]